MDCMLIPKINHRTATDLARKLHVDIDITYQSIKSKVEEMSEEPFARDDDMLYIYALESNMYDIDRNFKKLCSNLFIEDLD